MLKKIKQLNEVSMNPSSFKDSILAMDDKALIGFEFEFVFTSKNEKFIRVTFENIVDPKFLEKYFISRKYANVGDILNKVYNEYKLDMENRAYAWGEANYKSFMADGVNEDDAIEHAIQFAIKNKKGEIPFEKWLINNFNSVNDFCQIYRLEPKNSYLRNDDYLDDNEDIIVSDNPISIAANELSSYLKIKISDESDANYSNWFITKDSSVTTNVSKHIYGLELISPPMKPSEALEKLKNVFDAFKALDDIHTDNTTGLHVNISVTNIKNANLLKLILFIGENNLLNKFDRENNSYTESWLSVIAKKIRSIDILNGDLKDFENYLNSVINSEFFDKYKTINFSKLLDYGYIEFRITGGKGYENKFYDLYNTIGRYLRVIHIATEENAYRNEYIKKLYSLREKLKQYFSVLYKKDK